MSTVLEVARVAPGRGLQTQLGVRGHRVVHEHDRTGQLAVVQELKHLKNIYYK